MKTMLAKFSGTCVACGGSIRRGDQINYFGRGNGAAHVACGLPCDEQGEVSELDEYQEGPNGEPSMAMLANDRRLARNGLSVARFSSGAVVTQNSRGRCEDAPCCGCCS